LGLFIFYSIAMESSRVQPAPRAVTTLCFPEAAGECAHQKRRRFQQSSAIWLYTFRWQESASPGKTRIQILQPRRARVMRAADVDIAGDPDHGPAVPLEAVGNERARREPLPPVDELTVHVDQVAIPQGSRAVAGLLMASRGGYKQPDNWTASPNELDAAASQLDTWHGNDARPSKFSRDL